MGRQQVVHLCPKTPEMQPSEVPSGSVNSSRASPSLAMGAGDREAQMSNTDLFSIREAMEFLGGICRGTLYKLIKGRRLPAVTIGRRRFIRRRAMEES